MAGQTVLTCGVWDLFHHGHRRLIDRARTYGDRLVVGVQDDLHALKGHAVQPLATRLAVVAEHADEVVAYGSGVDGRVLRDTLPAVYVHGDDWRSQADRTEVERVASEIGCRIVLLPRTPGVSSTLLRAR